MQKLNFILLLQIQVTLCQFVSNDPTLPYEGKFLAFTQYVTLYIFQELLSLKMELFHWLQQNGFWLPTKTIQEYKIWLSILVL